jgi:hypothetical protein
MSLSDYIRYLRALNGGHTPWEIADKTGLQPGAIHLLEVKHRRVGEDDTLLEKLAEYFGVPATDLTSRRETYRKRFATFLDERTRDTRPVELKLESGETIEGRVEWYAREAVAIVPGDEGSGHNPIVVQRGWVADWRVAAEPWEIAGAQG